MEFRYGRNLYSMASNTYLFKVKFKWLLEGKTSKEQLKGQFKGQEEKFEGQMRNVIGCCKKGQYKGQFINILFRPIKELSVARKTNINPKYKVQHTTYNIQCTTNNVQRTTYYNV
jgi:hypothetical protein